MSAASMACGLCGVSRRQHDRLWVDTVPHEWVQPTFAQISARTERANPGKRVAR